MGLFGKRSEAKARFAHAIAGLNVLIEGWIKFQEDEPVIGVLMAVLGLGMVAFARFHRHLHHTRFARHLETAMFLVEATVLFLIATAFFRRGKHALPWCYVLAACGYVAVALWRHFHPYRHEHPETV